MANALLNNYVNFPDGRSARIVNCFGGQYQVVYNWQELDLWAEAIRADKRAVSLYLCPPFKWEFFTGDEIHDLVSDTPKYLLEGVALSKKHSIIQPIQRNSPPRNFSQSATAMSSVASSTPLRIGSGSSQEIEIMDESVKQILSYNPVSGKFNWLVSVGKRSVVGQEAGSINDEGYVYIQVSGKRYSGHRLAWFFVTGEVPTGQIDHINGVRDDNRFSNLRDVSQRENCGNRVRPNTMNTTGFLGVTLFRGEYLAQVTVNGCRHRKSFSSAELAHQWYKEMKSQNSASYDANTRRNEMRTAVFDSENVLIKVYDSKKEAKAHNKGTDLQFIDTKNFPEGGIGEYATVEDLFPPKEAPVAEGEETKRTRTVVKYEGKYTVLKADNARLAEEDERAKLHSALVNNDNVEDYLAAAPEVANFTSSRGATQKVSATGYLAYAVKRGWVVMGDAPVAEEVVVEEE